MPKTPTKAGGGFSTSRSPSPTSKKPSDPDIDLKLDKIKITPFSEAKDWESTVFELKLLLKQVWKDPTLDIGQYLSDDSYAASKTKSKAAITADRLIYYILSVGSVRGSFARNAIIAAQSTSAQPHIPEDDGFSLFKYIFSIQFSHQPKNTKSAFHWPNKHFTH